MNRSPVSIAIGDSSGQVSIPSVHNLHTPESIQFDRFDDVQVFGVRRADLLFLVGKSKLLPLEDRNKQDVGILRCRIRMVLLRGESALRKTSGRRIYAIPSSHINIII